MKGLFIICLVIFVHSVLSEEEFIPTNEWQIVKEGQRIPPGLHVRLNLETGLREAKLLDPNEQQSSDVIPVSPDTSQEEISRRNLEQAFANLDLSKDDVPTDQTHEDEVRQKYRPYDELKKEFESLNMKIETDQEIVMNLIEQLNKTDNHENQKTVLTDLEYYLHQYDNAILFADSNGLDLFIHLLNSTETNSEIRLLTCLALGAAFQGNPKVQSKALSLGFIQHILRLLNTESDGTVIHRSLYTLSTLLRNFPQAQTNFLEHGGAEIMVKLLDRTDKIFVRVVTLMDDLITEKDQANDEKREIYATIQIRDQLVSHGWCSSLSARFTSLNPDDFDYIEKTITAMLSFTDVCQTNFISLIPTFDQLKTNPSYTNSIEHFLTKLRRRSSDDL